MRSILEQAIVHLLNEEQDKAEALFHKFMVERARQIHESLRQGEDPILDESWDEITEADLDDLAETEEEEAEEVAEAAEDTADAADAVEAELSDAEEASDEAGEDAEEAMDGEEAVEARLEDLEAQLEKLTAEFEAMMADEDEAASDEMDSAEEDAEMADAVADDMEETVTEEDEAVDEDEFEDITESVLDDLDTVSVANVDGVGADGSKLAGNHESPVAKKAVAKGVEVDTEHKHDDFDLEAAPASKEVKGARNAKKSVADAIAPVPAGGDKKAKLNKPNYSGE